MNTVHDAISRFRRQLALSSFMQNGIVLLMGAAVVFTVLPLGPRNLGIGLLIVATGLGVTLAFRSMRGVQEANDVPSLIAAGDFAEAESRIDRGLRSFSLFRASRLMQLHHLIILRHAQRRWAEAGELARTLLRQRLGGMRKLSNSTRILLADSLLENGDVRGAYGPLDSLYRQRLTLAEALGLLRVQLDYLARIGQWGQMLAGLAERVRLCELMPPGQSALSQALLAVAAKRTGKDALSVWLRERAELLMASRELIDHRPVLEELFADATNRV